MKRAPPDSRLPNIKVYPRDLAPAALVVGDPDRVREASSLLTDVREIGRNREYVTVTGEHEGRRLTVGSHGVGAGGANVYFMELLRGGVRTLIRAGTCGALDPELEDGDLVVVTGAVREDRATDGLMPVAYPAIADRAVLAAILAAVEAEGGPPAHVGLAVSEANFYATLYPPRWQTYVGQGVKGVEMELAGLFVLASMHGARAGGLLVTDGNLVRDRDPDMSDYDPDRPEVAQGSRRMLRVAIRALAALPAAGEA